MAFIFGEINEFKDFLIIVLSCLTVFVLWIFFRLRAGADLIPSMDGRPNEFTWTTIFISLWYFSGMVLDGWAHVNGVVDESFFTKWHALFYSGFIAFAGFTTWTLWRLHDGPIPTNLGSLTDFFKGMPKGYGSATAGMMIFGLAGAGDMIWHIVFGIEGGLDILLSPTHLLLAAGMAIGILAPFWAAWHHPHENEHTFKGQLAPIISLSISMSVLTFFTKYAHPFNLNLSEICQGHGNPLAANAANCPTKLRDHGGLTQLVYDTTGLQLGVVAMEIQAFIIVGTVLLFMHRWSPAKGSLLTLLTLNGVAVSFIAPGDLNEVPIRILIYVLLGIICELLVSKFNPKSSEIKLRIFAFLLPFISMIVWWLATIYDNRHKFDLLIDTGEGVIYPLGWSIHATFGAFFLAGCTGVFTSLLMSPPEIKEDMHQMPKN